MKICSINFDLGDVFEVYEKVMVDEENVMMFYFSRKKLYIG